MKCHICDGSVSSFIDEKTGMTYYFCSECAYIFKASEHYQDLSDQKMRYDLHENDEKDAGYQAYFQRFLDFLLPQISEVRTALDFGCGRSTLLAQMLENNSIACDVYDPIYHPDTLSEDKKYDLIVSTEVFEHLHQPREVFESLLSRLEEGGYLALQTQFHPNEREKFKKWYYHQDPTHIVFFTARTFKRLATYFGCDSIGDNGKNMVLLRKRIKETV